MSIRTNCTRAMVRLALLLAAVASAFGQAVCNTQGDTPLTFGTEIECDITRINKGFTFRAGAGASLKFRVQRVPGRGGDKVTISVVTSETGGTVVPEATGSVGDVPVFPIPIRELGNYRILVSGNVSFRGRFLLSCDANCTITPAPSLTRLNPNSVVARNTDLPVEVNGTGFVQGSAMQWNGSAVPGSFVDATRINATVPARLLAQAGSAVVTVKNPDSRESNALPFTISPANQTAGTATELSASPAKIELEGVEGNEATLESSVTLSSANGGTFGLGRVAESWLAVSPNGGSTPASIRVIVSTRGLPQGQNTGTVTFQGAAGNTLTLPVIVRISKLISGALHVDTTNLDLRVNRRNRDQTIPGLISIRNLSNSTISIQATKDRGSNWLQITPEQTSVGSEQQAEFRVIGAPPPPIVGGLFLEDKVILSGGGQTFQVPVRMLESAEGIGEVLVSPESVTLFTLPGENKSDVTKIQLYNSGATKLSWSVTPSNTSIDAAPSFRQAQEPGTVADLEVRTTSLINDMRPGEERKSSLDFVFSGLPPDTPVEIPIAVQALKGSIMQPRPDRSGLFLGVGGVREQTVKIRSFSIGAVKYKVGQLPTWLTVTPPEGSLEPQKTDGTPGFTELKFRIPQGVNPPARAREKVAISVPELNGSLTVEVVAVTAAGVSGSKQESRAACSVNAYDAVILSPGSPMEVSSGLPVTIEAQVVDGCGDLTTDGAAVLTFSTGEPAVNLAAWPDGVFRGTWTPIKPSTSTVFLRFSFVPRDGVGVARATASGVVSGSGNSPVINSAATVNSASRIPTGASFAPGQLLTISGEALANGTESALDSPRQRLAGARVRFGSRSLPLFYASPTQLNIAIPFDLAAGTSGQLFLDRDGIPASPVNVTVSPAQPGIFTVDESGTGRGVIRDVDGNLIDVDNRAARGSTVRIYCAGLGPVDRAASVFDLLPAEEPLPRPTLPVSVLIGNSSAEVTSAFLAPGAIGIYLIEARVPQQAPANDSVPVEISVNGARSNTVTMAVR